ncbi:MAG: J domain-containing protein [Ignavibacteria bacterium]|nr:J domain-containing protein [Ignavibacteria bacterium]
MKKIEQLREQTVELTARLNRCLQYYSDEMHPKEKEIAHLRADITKRVYPIYCEKKLLNKGEKKIIKEFFKNQFTSITPFMELDEVLNEVFEEAHGATFDQVRQDEFEEMRVEMKEMFESMGVDVNLDNLTSEMGEEEIARKMHEVMNDIKNKAEENEAQESLKIKTKKQLAKEEQEEQKEELRNTSIGKIYRSLAKAFHPDLERDIKKIAEKEELMKRLTVAYESNDLHTLLSLELEWIKNEEGDIKQLSNEKLRLYNQILKEQAQEIEDDMLMMTGHPRYHPLKSFFPEYISPFDWHEFTLRQISIEMKLTIKSIKNSLKALERNPLKEVRNIIEAYLDLNNQQPNDEDLNELLDMIIKFKGR